MRTDHRCRLHDNKCAAPIEQPCQDGQADSSCRIYRSRLDAALEGQRQLTAQEEVLGLDRFGRTEQQHHPAQGRFFDQAQCNPGEGDDAPHRAAERSALSLPRDAALGWKADTRSPRAGDRLLARQHWRDAFPLGQLSNPRSGEHDPHATSAMRNSTASPATSARSRITPAGESDPVARLRGQHEHQALACRRCDGLRSRAASDRLVAEEIRPRCLRYRDQDRPNDALQRTCFRLWNAWQGRSRLLPEDQ